MSDTPTINPTADYDEYVWQDLNAALDTLEHIGEQVCLSELITYAEDNDFDQGIRDRLQKLSAAIWTLMDDGQTAIWDFAKAAGMTDGLVAREQRQRDEERRQEADPNSLTNMLRKKRREDCGRLGISYQSPPSAPGGSVSR